MNIKQIILYIFPPFVLWLSGLQFEPGVPLIVAGIIGGILVILEEITFDKMPAWVLAISAYLYPMYVLWLSGAPFELSKQVAFAHTGGFILCVIVLIMARFKKNDPEGFKRMTRCNGPGPM